MLKQKTQAELIEELNFGTPYVASKAENELKRRGLLDSDSEFMRPADPLSRMIKGILSPTPDLATPEMTRRQAMASAITPSQFSPEVLASVASLPKLSEDVSIPQRQALPQMAREMLPAQPQFAPVSRPEMPMDMMSGLFGNVANIGSGILGTIGGAINPEEIMQAYALAEQARMQQPALVTASQLASLRPVTAAGALAMAPEAQQMREQRQLKSEVEKERLSQVRAIKEYRKEASKAKPDIAKLQELARVAYPELAAKQQFAKTKPETKSQIQARVMAKALQSGVGSLSPEEKQVYDSSLRAPDVMSTYMVAPTSNTGDTITIPENFNSLSDEEKLKILEG